MASYFNEAPSSGSFGGAAPGPGSEGTVAVRRGRRRWLIALIALGVVLFLLISFEVARFYSVESLEREDLVALLQAEARGSAPEMLAQLSGCQANPTCVETVRANAAKLHRPGSIKILTLDLPHGGLAHRGHRHNARGMDGDRDAAGGAVRAREAHRQRPYGHLAEAAHDRAQDRKRSGLLKSSTRWPQLRHS